MNGPRILRATLSLSLPIIALLLASGSVWADEPQSKDETAGQAQSDSSTPSVSESPSERSAPALPAGLASPAPGPTAPALPAGLGDPADENPSAGTRSGGPPALPSGLATPPSGSGPALPSGLGGREDENPADDMDGEEHRSAWSRGWTGFWDLRYGSRLRSDPNQRRTSIFETRLQLSRETGIGNGLLRLTADLVYDDVAPDHGLDLETGQGVLDLREAYYGVPIGDRLDLRVGRQVLTWGVGDLLFLNDLFPKDWNAFFVGRDVEYLKAPSDAVRAAFFHPVVNVDLVYTPRFDADRYLDNERLSFFDPRFGRIAGGDVPFEPVVPDDWFGDDEWAVRLHRLLGGWELAAYGYRGFWKSPEGFDPVTGRPRFPQLDVWGASARGTLGRGVLSAEFAWYDSREDAAGSNPFVPNSEQRFLVGWDQELVADLSLGLQYYVERTADHSRLLATWPEGVGRPPDRHRHLVTTRLTWLTHGQNVTWSAFVFASPSDRDAYLRGSWSWKPTDRWTVSAGFNAFEGREEDSFFGQFESNTNAWTAIRYGF
jgi:hypothetical protein